VYPVAPGHAKVGLHAANGQYGGGDPAHTMAPTTVEQISF